MKAAVLHEFGKPLRVEEVQDPQPGPDEVVIRVMACGIDGTDLKLLNGFGYTPALPFIMGHEPAGVVDQVGQDVTRFQPGDRVIPYIFLIPPDSSWYQSSREQLCPDMTGVVGVRNAQGAYAERLCIAQRQLVRVPETVAWKDAAVLCDAGLTAWHAVDRARLQEGESVVVLGVGGVGSFVVQIAKLRGAKVIAVEQSADRAQWATDVGADHVLNTTSDHVPDAVHDLTGANGTDCVMDIVGSRQTLAHGVDSLRVGGRLVVVGYTPDTCELSPKHLAQNEVELIGSRGGTRRDLAAVTELMAKGRLRSIVTQTRPLHNVNESLEELRQGRVHGRLVLDLQQKETPV